MQKHTPFTGSFESIDWSAWTPLDRATLLFTFRGDEMLMIHKKRGLGAGKINAPGGRIDPGESPLEAAVREVQEELMVTPLEPKEAGELFFQFRDGYSLHATVFTANTFTGTPTETDEAVPHWIHRDKIPYERMWADDFTWMPLLLAGTAFCGHYLFEGETMLAYKLESVLPGYLAHR